MTNAPPTNELLALADHVRSVALNAADHIGHANYTHRIVEAKQSIREACDKMDDAIRAAATPSAQGAETTISNLTLDIAESSNLSWQEAKTIATALLGKYRMEKR